MLDYRLRTDWPSWRTSRSQPNDDYAAAVAAAGHAIVAADEGLGDVVVAAEDVAVVAAANGATAVVVALSSAADVADATVDGVVDSATAAAGASPPRDGVAAPPLAALPFSDDVPLPAAAFAKLPAVPHNGDAARPLAVLQHAVDALALPHAYDVLLPSFDDYAPREASQPHTADRL